MDGGEGRAVSSPSGVPHIPPPVFIFNMLWNKVFKGRNNHVLTAPVSFQKRIRKIHPTRTHRHCFATNSKGNGCFRPSRMFKNAQPVPSVGVTDKVRFSEKNLKALFPLTTFNITRYVDQGFRRYQANVRNVLNLPNTFYSAIYGDMLGQNQAHVKKSLIQGDT